MEETIKKSGSGSGCLLRLYWMFGGNVVLLFLAVFLVQKHYEFPSWLDLVYLIIVATLLAVRYIDISYMQGETAEGKPASASDFRMYAHILLIISSIVWALTFFLR